ncbi:hypothetical protein ACSYDW_16590 [Paeniglutamicibacter sp. R2-26]|uniref:hypothetical protein n=1 Tax=Paeniglutamicibacter sp. R2-26 TaxID=3144417 RepID=UPI003EE479C3
MASRPTTRQSASILAAALAGALFVSGCTSSSADASTFNACIDVESLQFSAISLSPQTPPECRETQVAVSWAADATRANQETVDSFKEPTGETGASGHAGADGEDGEPGVDGTDGEQGEDGAAGSDGRDGAKGDTGSAGLNGAKGETGTSGTKGETGATGSEGSKGEAGAPGVKGENGSPGAKGDQGELGAKGETGAAGVKGDTGAAGAKGETGAAGAKGDTGATGAKGDQGETGAKGDAGAAGVKGETGATGLPGQDGKSIHNGVGSPSDTLGIDGDFYLDTQDFVVYGPKAGGVWPNLTQKLIGEQGPIGPSGPTGAQGPVGATGATGETGQTGAAGPTGAAGSTGETGANGPQGAAGPQGAQGAKGDAGAAGAPPVFMSTIPFIDPQDNRGYFAVSGASSIVKDAADADMLMPRAGTLKGLSIAASSRAGTISVTLNVNGAATALTCEIPASETSCQELDESVAVDDQDEVSFSYSSTGIVPVKNLRYAVGFEGQ